MFWRITDWNTRCTSIASVTSIEALLSWISSIPKGNKIKIEYVQE